MPIIQFTLLNSFTSHPITFTTQIYTQTVCISIRLKAIFPFDSVHRKFMEKSIFHRCHNYHWTSNPPEIHTIRHFGYIISQFHKEVALWGFVCGSEFFFFFSAWNRLAFVTPCCYAFWHFGVFFPFFSSASRAYLCHFFFYPSRCAIFIKFYVSSA